MLPKILIAIFTLVILAIALIFHNNPEITQESSDCSNPLVLQTPVDLNKATSILYPGQIRGGDFKPHGGFRFDNSKTDEIEVRAPAGAEFVAASRYLEKGEVQYLFDFKLPCGIMYRFDHLLTLSPKFAEIIKDLPEPKEQDSSTSDIKQKLSVTKGEIIATGVGIKKDNNVFVDFGVYDMRGKFLQGPRNNAICWFDLLPASDSAKVKSLPPADSTSGSQSTLCKP